MHEVEKLEIARIDQWLIWKIKDGRKIPLNKHGLPTGVNREWDYMTFEDAVEASEKFSSVQGVAFVFTKDDPYFGIDLDSACEIESYKDLKPWAKAIAERAGSYSETSPSLTGCKIICRGKLPEGCRHRFQCGDGDFECYEHGRFFTITGVSLDDFPKVINDFDPSELLSEIAPQMVESVETVAFTYSGEGGEQTERIRSYLSKVSLVEGSRNNTAFNAAGHVKSIVNHDGVSVSFDEALGLLREWNSQSANPLPDDELSDVARSGWMKGTPRKLKYPNTIEVPTDFMDNLPTFLKNESNRERKEEVELQDIGGGMEAGSAGGLLMPKPGEASGNAVGWRPPITKNTDMLEIASSFINEHKAETLGDPLVFGGTLRRWRGDWYQWTTSRGVFEKITDETFRSLLHRWLHPRYVGYSNTQVVRLISDVMALAEVHPTRELNTWFGDPPFNGNYLAFQNGITSVEQLLEGSVELHPPTPQFFSVSTLDYELPAEQAAEKWTSFLEQVLPEPADRDCLQEFAGLALTDWTYFQKFLILYGVTRAGKGVITRAIQLVLGSTATSTDFDALYQPKECANLIGKNFVVVNDARSNHGNRDKRAVSTERILKTTGEDLQTIQIKYKSAVDTKLCAKIMVVSNEMIDFGDAAGAIAARALIIEFTKSFVGKEDFTLGKQLEKERGGIFWWMLEGLQRLKSNSKFTMPHSHGENIQALKVENDPVVAFLSEFCTCDPSDESLTVSKDNLFRAYQVFCKMNGISAGRGIPFKRDIEKVHGFKSIRRRDGDQRIQSFRGIELNAEGNGSIKPAWLE